MKCLMVLLYFLPSVTHADSWLFPQEITHQITLFSGQKLTLIMDSIKNRYFIGVSNNGIPKTIFIIFDANGKVIKYIKHWPMILKYSDMPVTLMNVWYGKKDSINKKLNKTQSRHFKNEC